MANTPPPDGSHDNSNTPPLPPTSKDGRVKINGFHVPKHVDGAIAHWRSDASAHESDADASQQARGRKLHEALDWIGRLVAAPRGVDVDAHELKRADEHAAVADAFRRLLDVADRDSGQPVKVRRFLLACWNAETFGGWDPSELWALDREIGADMLRVLGAYAHGLTGHYADHYGEDVARRMKCLAEESATRKKAKQ